MITRKHFLIVSENKNHKPLHVFLVGKGNTAAYCLGICNMTEVANIHFKKTKRNFDFVILNFRSDNPFIQKQILSFRKQYPETEMIFLGDISIKEFMDLLRRRENENSDLRI